MNQCVHLETISFRGWIIKWRLGRARMFVKSQVQIQDSINASHVDKTRSPFPTLVNDPSEEKLKAATPKVIKHSNLTAS